MKALTIWQPYASLKACGTKKFETRGWMTKYRGPIAIHAAKAYYEPFSCELPAGLREATSKVLWPGVTDLCAITDNWDELPRGCVIATGKLIECFLIGEDIGGTFISRRNATGDYVKYSYIKDKDELLFGDWTSGRYAWEIVNVKMFQWPIPAKGQQGLWNWTPPEDAETVINRIEVKIRMIRTVRPSMPFLAPIDTVLTKDKEYRAESNKNGAVSGICENGQRLGVRPGEFEFVSAPQWLFEKWRSI